MARPRIEKKPAFPPVFDPMKHQTFVEMLPRWFVNHHEDHRMLLDELSGLWYARSLEYGVAARGSVTGRGPVSRLVQIAGDNAEACLMIDLRANVAPMGAFWEALFAIYTPGVSHPMYGAQVFRKCVTNERAALMTFLERIPLL